MDKPPPPWWFWVGAVGVGVGGVAAFASAPLATGGRTRRWNARAVA